MTGFEPKQTLKVVFACSGSADVGELADRAARQLARDGIASMSCVAAVGGRVDDIIFNAQLAGKVLAINGCPQRCASKTLQHAELNRIRSFDLQELGFVKGRCPVTLERTQQVVSKAAEMLES